MSSKVAIVYHSGFGHTARQAEAVEAGVKRVVGVECRRVAVADLKESDAAGWSQVDEADAIIFGCPTYMGGPAAEMRRFMEQSSSRWMGQKWADKLGAGFTNSGSPCGDKHNTLVALATFAAQHGMVWVNLNLLPGNNSSTGSDANPNRLGASLGAMSQSNVDQGADVAPPESDLETARQLGKRVAQCALRWAVE